MYLRRPACILCLIFVIGIRLIISLGGGVDKSEDHPDGADIYLTGIIEKRQIKNDSPVIYVRNVKKGNGCIIVYPADPYKDPGLYKIGSRISLKGSYSNFETAENDGQFDMRLYYRIRGLRGKVVKAVPLYVSGDHSRIKEGLHNIQTRTMYIYEQSLPKREAGIMCALVLGDRTLLDDEIKELYQNAGIAHILSLSGLHVATIGLFIIKFLKRSGVGRVPASLIAIVIISCYAAMTGMSISTQRALIMFGICLLADMLGRTYDLLTAAALSAVLILFREPYYVYDSGYLLSFGAVAGIGLLYQPLDRATDMGFKMDKIRKSFILGLSVLLATLPITLDCFYQLPKYGTVLNLLVVPLTGVLIADGIAGAIAGNVAELLFDIANVQYILKPSEIILRFYELLASVIGKGNAVMISGRPGSLRTAVYICMISLSIYIISLKNDRSSQIRKACKYKGKLRFIDTDKPKIGLHNFYLFAGVIIAVTGVLFIVFPHREKSPMMIKNLSVGQGDCSLIFGKNTPVILIDGGSTSVDHVGKYRISPCLKANGIDRVDYMIVSHPDSDHINGLIELLEDKGSGIRYKRLLLPRVPEANAGYDRIIELAGERDMEVYIMQKGDVINDRKLLIECLSPDTSSDDGSWRMRDINDNSLVIKLTETGSSFSALFTGDISKDTESLLCVKADYLKVAHHGSKGSSSEAFLTATSPLISVISCGYANRYGHPHKETLDRFNTCLPSSYLYRTDLNGQITVRLKGADAVLVESFR